MSLGIAASSMIEENYRPEVVDEYHKLVADLNSSDPLGRLSILNGPPGTGKTYLIRALLNDLPNHKFLIMPSNMVESLGGPQLLQSLISIAQELKDEPESSEKECYPSASPPTTTITKIKEGGRPLVLVIEDADRCLASRAADNVSAISSILNLSDGIIGNLLNLRIICTTNVEVDSIDEALLRTGRLSTEIEVGLLDQDQAKQVYTRLGGKDDQLLTNKFYALSDIYALVKDNQGGVATTESHKHAEKKTVGFRPWSEVECGKVVHEQDN